MPGKFVAAKLVREGCCLLVASFALSACAHHSHQKTSAVAAEKASSQTCPTLRLTFVVDQDYDAHTIYSILQGEDPAGLTSRAASMGISPALANAIHGATSYEAMAASLASAVASRYAELGRDMARARGAYEAAWASLVPEFSERVTSVTAHCWIHSEYKVVVSAFHPGLSNWSGNVVASKFDHELEAKRRIVAHEIVLSQAFQLLRASHPPEEVSDWPVWAFAEITAAIVLDDAALRRYWPKFPSENYFAHSNYPQLASLETELRRRFRTSSNFDEYLFGAVPVLKQLDRDRLLRPTK